MEAYILSVAIFFLFIAGVIALLFFSFIFIVVGIAKAIKDLIFGNDKKDEQTKKGDVLEIRIIGQNGTDIDYKINRNSSDIRVDKV